MALTKQDVRDAYRVVLGREPESEAVVECHIGHADKPALLGSLLASDESARRNGSSAVHKHQIYKGYNSADLEVLRQFSLYTGASSRGFVTNFLGIKYRVGFAPGLPNLDGKIEDYPEPVGSHQGETAEFVGTLRSVVDASDGRFRMLECGAGYGTWMAISFAAACQKKINDVHVYGIEAERGHFEFLETHMADNGILPFTAYYGAVGTSAGFVEWAVSRDPAADYGGNVDRKGAETRRVEIFDIAAVLDEEPYWDLVHIDIQGAEAELCRNRIAALSEKVRRVVIGTHSREIDGELMGVFFKAGWQLENEKPTIFQWEKEAPSLDTMTYVDGVQVWRNPKFLP